MENKNDNPPWLGCGIVTVLLVALAIMILRSCSELASGLIQEKGFWIWMLVIGGIALLVFLVMRADRGGK